MFNSSKCAKPPNAKLPSLEKEGWLVQATDYRKLNEPPRPRLLCQGGELWTNCAKLAETLGVNQGEISKIEHRADLYLSTLAEYVEALGGRLEIRAVFADREVRITQFEELAKRSSL